ncbi:MAG: hypothetical protein ACKVPX_10810 [Myxococcaceae bacterium]
MPPIRAEVSDPIATFLANVPTPNKALVLEAQRLMQDRRNWPAVLGILHGAANSPPTAINTVISVLEANPPADLKALARTYWTNRSSQNLEAYAVALADSLIERANREPRSHKLFDEVMDAFRTLKTQSEIVACSPNVTGAVRRLDDLMFKWRPRGGGPEGFGGCV